MKTFLLKNFLGLSAPAALKLNTILFCCCAVIFGFLVLFHVLEKFIQITSLLLHIWNDFRSFVMHGWEYMKTGNSTCSVNYAHIMKMWWNSNHWNMQLEINMCFSCCRCCNYLEVWDMNFLHSFLSHFHVTIFYRYKFKQNEQILNI